MKAFSLCKLAVCIAVLLASGFVLRSQAAAPQVRKDVYDINTYVPFEVGATFLRNGDKITIEEMHGTADKIAVGGLYEIKGTYTLASHDKADLAIEVTSSDTKHYPTLKPQYMKVDKGDGHFTVYLYMWTEGNPHMSFYPADGGSSFASVYFGTGESVLKHASWLE